MPRAKNPFFQFKQFTVWQQHAALKVCTEACLLGAYVAVENTTHVLDIGTGTGLLALMMAQRATQAHITAVEIEPNAAQQAQENVNKSPFAQQIKVYQTAIQDFTHSERFDLIVCNPPFFNNHLLSEQPRRNLALHTQQLSFNDLAAHSQRLLAASGRLVVLLPAHETQLFTATAAQCGFFASTQLAILQQPNAAVVRFITTFARTQHLTPHQSSMYIHEPDGSYSTAFKTLLKPYYLHF